MKIKDLESVVIINLGDARVGRAKESGKFLMTGTDAGLLALAFVIWQAHKAGDDKVEQFVPWARSRIEAEIFPEA